MVVRTMGSGREVTGLYVGTRNARRHFPRNTQHVELQLGHLHIYCDLPPGFWDGCPEICDPRLGDWLSSRLFHGRRQRFPAPIAMIPLGKNIFHLQPFTMPPASMNALTHIGPTPARGQAGITNHDCREPKSWKEVRKQPSHIGPA